MYYWEVSMIIAMLPFLVFQEMDSGALKTMSLHNATCLKGKAT
jgi:hypothetical protein